MASFFSNITQIIDHKLNDFFHNFERNTRDNIFAPTVKTEIFEEIKELTLRGGKRIRSILMFLGHDLFKANGIESEALLNAALSVELLQTYLLIHDDIMDNDNFRRGGDSVHFSLGKKLNSTEKGRLLGILAGDTANAMSGFLFSKVSQCKNIGDDSFAMANKLFARMHMDVVIGQDMDLMESATPYEISLRKTASYTTIGPMCIGAAIAGACGGQIELVADIARPMGIAFQYRDDLIGVIGSGENTGKTPGVDIINGKKTFLLEDALEKSSFQDSNFLKEIMVNKKASKEELKKAISIVENCGSKQRIEKQICLLSKQALAHSEALQLNPQARGLLIELINKLTSRIS